MKPPKIPHWYAGCAAADHDCAARNFRRPKRTMYSCLRCHRTEVVDDRDLGGRGRRERSKRRFALRQSAHHHGQRALGFARAVRRCSDPARVEVLLDGVRIYAKLAAHAAREYYRTSARQRAEGNADAR